MKAKRIIIISSTESLRNFFKLEALNFEFSVDCFEKFERSLNDISSYDLAIIDIDTITQKPLNSAKREITVSSHKEKADMNYPLSVFELRKIYNQLFSENIIKDIPESKSIKIIFYNNEKNKVSVGKRKYILSNTEYNILTLLCANSHKTVTREEMQKLFENDNSNICDVYICKLRKKLEEALEQRLIFTVREKGYKIVAEAEWR
jgi:DNA-binding response OmpR family regulator